MLRPAVRSERILTPIDIFDDRLINDTLLGSADVLGPLLTALRAEAPSIVHGPLQSIALPAKHVITVLSVAGRVSSAEDEGLGAILGPVIGIIKRGRIPDNLDQTLVMIISRERKFRVECFYLKHELRNLHRMAGRAGAR